MFNSQIVEKLDKSKSILLCGCGGGYDIFSGMPIYHKYTNKVTLANITFANYELLDKLIGEKNCITKNGYVNFHYKDRKFELLNKYPDNYVPEYWLSKALNKNIYIIEPSGVKILYNIFNKIIQENNIDTIVLVDGGIDSLMFGDEEDIGTFTEDMGTLISISLFKDIESIVVTNAWGVERVSQNRYFENISTLIRQNGFLGAQMLEKDSKEGQFYMNILDECFPENSTINMHIYSAIIGQNWSTVHKHLLKRGSKFEAQSKFYLQAWYGCPLGAIYWFFDLQKVINNVKYKDKILNTTDLYEISKTVHNFRFEEKLVDIDGNFIGERTSTFF